MYHMQLKEHNWSFQFSPDLSKARRTCFLRTLSTLRVLSGHNCAAMKWCALVLGARWQNRRPWAHPHRHAKTTMAYRAPISENDLNAGRKYSPQRYKKEPQWGGKEGRKCSGVSIHTPSTMTHKQEESLRVSPRNEGSEPHIRVSNLGPAPWAPKMPALKISSSAVQESWGLRETKTVLLKVAHKVSHALSPSPEAADWKARQTHLLILENNPRKQKAVRNPPGVQTGYSHSQDLNLQCWHQRLPHPPAFPQQPERASQTAKLGAHLPTPECLQLGPPTTEGRMPLLYPQINQHITPE